MPEGRPRPCGRGQIPEAKGLQPRHAFDRGGEKIAAAIVALATWHDFGTGRSAVFA